MEMRTECEWCAKTLHLNEVVDQREVIVTRPNRPTRTVIKSCCAECYPHEKPIYDAYHNR